MMSLFRLPTVRIRRSPRNARRRAQDWTKLFLSLTDLFGGFDGAGDKTILIQARIENTCARTEAARAQTAVTTLRAQKMGNEVTLSEQKVEKLELEITKLRHELKARGIVQSAEFADPHY